MTKSDMAEKLAARLSGPPNARSFLLKLSKLQAQAIIDMFTNSVIEALAKGDKVEIRGFGSFRVRHRPAKEGRNPKTGAKAFVPPKKVPFFKAGKDLGLTVDGKAAKPTARQPTAYK